MHPNPAIPALEALLDHLEQAEWAPTTVTERSAARDAHIADSLSGLQVAELRAARSIADIGAGAGFPGLVLATALPEAAVHLVESAGRKCEFIAAATAHARIRNVTVVHARAEEWSPDAPLDVVTARAVGRLAELAELSVPLLREGGVLVAWKGARDAEEEGELDRASDRLNAALARIEPVIPFAGSRERHLYVVRKTGATPAGLPRRAGMARKRPFGAER